jgi:hypothetical protein
VCQARVPSPFRSFFDEGNLETKTSGRVIFSVSPPQQGMGEYDRAMGGHYCSEKDSGGNVVCMCRDTRSEVQR